MGKGNEDSGIPSRMSTKQQQQPAVAQVKKGVGKAPDKKNAKRRTNQDRAGLHVSVSRCKRIIHRQWKGKVSTEAAVTLAAFLQYTCQQIFTGAAATASEESPKSRITSAHVQAGLAKNRWLSKSKIIQGRVLGAAPIASAAGGNESDVEEEEEGGNGSE